MSKSSFFSRLLSATAAACLSMAAAVPAQGAVIAAFDPAFGPSIPNLGFRGTITLDVPTACYALGGGFHATGGACQITALSAQVNYYNVVNPNTILNTVSLNAAFFASTFVFGEYIDPLTGQLAGFDTNLSNTFPVTVIDNNPAGSVNYTGNMLLFFQSGFANPQLISIPGGFLRDCGSITVSSRCAANSTNTSLPARLTFTTVPEPDSVALALLGLGALLVARRRTIAKR